MDQPTLQELTEHGQKMELKGSDLQKFIRDQQAHNRELRAAEREREKEAREYELKKQTLEMDRIKMQEEQGKAELESKYRATIFHLEQQLKENLERSSQRYRTYYNKRARQRDMKEGEKVLVLLPTASNKLLMQWRGPYIIVQKVGSVDYKIDVDGKLKTFHANMLKRYVDRQDDDNISRDIVGVAVIDVENDSSTDDSDLNDSPSHLIRKVQRMSTSVMNLVREKLMTLKLCFVNILMFLQILQD
nr:uncharacterized protein LOC117684146 [Crassostrea gigas]